MLLTMMHSIIQYGLEAGKDVDLQQSTYDMKGQFGAMLEPTWIMAGSPSLLLRGLLRLALPRIATNKLNDYQSYHVYEGREDHRKREPYGSQTKMALRLYRPSTKSR